MPFLVLHLVLVNVMCYANTVKCGCTLGTMSYYDLIYRPYLVPASVRLILGLPFSDAAKKELNAAAVTTPFTVV